MIVDGDDRRSVCTAVQLRQVPRAYVKSADIASKKQQTSLGPTLISGLHPVSRHWCRTVMFKVSFPGTDGAWTGEELREIKGGLMRPISPSCCFILISHGWKAVWEERNFTVSTWQLIVVYIAADSVPSLHYTQSGCRVSPVFLSSVFWFSLMQKCFPDFLCK